MNKAKPGDYVLLWATPGITLDHSNNFIDQHDAKYILMKFLVVGVAKERENKLIIDVGGFKEYYGWEYNDSYKDVFGSVIHKKYQHSNLRCLYIEYESYQIIKSCHQCK